MSELVVSGGAGSFDASMVDLRRYGDRLVEEGREVLALAGPVARQGAEDLAEAAVVVPDRVPEVLAALAAAEARIILTGEALVIVGELVGVAVAGYEMTDAVGRDLLSRAQIAEGIALGLGAPATVGLAGVGTLAAVPAILADPTLAAQAAEYARSGRMGTDLQAFLYHHPEVLEEMTRTAPGYVQGAAMSTAAVVAPLAGPSVLSALSGGHWPTTDYEDAVAGLNALAGHKGALQDSGQFELDSVNSLEGPAEIRGVEDLMSLQNSMNDVRIPASQGQIRVVTVTGANGKPALVVQVPGTEEWSPTRGVNPVDLSTNTQAMAGADTVMKQKVAEAIRLGQAGLPPGTPVMLTGHSQGGIVAATLASDPTLVRELNICSLVTAGSPIARMPVDPGVSVLSLEHTQDVVPMLDGAQNPAKANWTTVRRELSADGGNAQPDLAGAHDLGKNYTETAGLVDSSDDASVRAWRTENAAFFGKGGSITYPIVRK